MNKTPSMSDLLKSVRKPIKERNYNPSDNATEQEIVYDLISEMIELRDSVGSSLNTMDEMLVILKEKVGEQNMFIDDNPYDDKEYDMYGNRIKKEKKINPMNIPTDGGFNNKHRKDKKSTILNAKL